MSLSTRGGEKVGKKEEEEGPRGLQGDTQRLHGLHGARTLLERARIYAHAFLPCPQCYSNKIVKKKKESHKSIKVQVMRFFVER